MAALYERNLKHEVIADVVRSVILGAIVIGILEVNAYLELPKVQLASDGKCVRVINFKNGDGYQCHDLGVVLRHYRLDTVPLKLAEVEDNRPAVAPSPPPQAAPAVVAPAPAAKQPQAKQEPSAKAGAAKK